MRIYCSLRLQGSKKSIASYLKTKGGPGEKRAGEYSSARPSNYHTWYVGQNSYEIGKKKKWLSKEI